MTYSDERVRDLQRIACWLADSVEAASDPKAIGHMIATRKYQEAALECRRELMRQRKVRASVETAEAADQHKRLRELRLLIDTLVELRQELPNS